MNNILFKPSFFIIGICMFSGYSYSAEKKSRPRMPTPPRKHAEAMVHKYISAEQCNNHIYIEVMVKETPIGVRYFTREQGCGPGSYFKTETITPLANIRNNHYSCLVKRKPKDGTSPISFTYKSSSTTISAQRSDTFVVHPEENNQIIITKKSSNAVVAQFTIK